MSLFKSEHRTGRSTIIFGLRFLLGTIFIIAAVFKLPHQAEFIQIVQGYGLLPSALSELYAILLPWAELILGIFLVLGLFPRLCTAFLSPITFSFIIANVYVLQGAGGAGLCGCFGDLIPLTHTQSLVMDFIMLLIAIPVMTAQTHLFSIDTRFAASYAFKCCAVIVAAVMIAGMVPSIVIPGTSGQTASASIPVEETVTNEKPVLLFFHADFCSYCQEEKPVIDELEMEYAGDINFVRVSTPDNKDLVKKWGIETIPTTVLAYNLDTGDECTRFTGLTEKQDIGDAIEAMLAETCPAPAETGLPETNSIMAEGIGLDTLINASLADDKPVFLFFYAEWCGYCQKQHPIIDALEEIYGDSITFIRARNEAYADDLEKWGVTGFPSMFLINGIENEAYTYLEFGGYTEQATLEATFNQLLASGSLPEHIVYSANSESENADRTNLDQEVDISLIEGHPVFLLFYSDLCQTCQEQAPIIDELETVYGDNITFIRARSDDYSNAATDWGVTALPDMFLVIDYEARTYTYQEFKGFTEKDSIVSSFDYLLENGTLPEESLQIGYVHHSCSTGLCFEECMAKKMDEKLDEFGAADASDILNKALDVALDCTGIDKVAFQNAYNQAKNTACVVTCANANTPREGGDCAQCCIEQTLGQIPGVDCFVDVASILADYVLEPAADCLAECKAPSSTWSDDYGHECRDHQGYKSQCQGDYLETYECVQCQWELQPLTHCDGGCEMTEAGAVCKDKCKEEWCDDGDDCTIDYCLNNKCYHLEDDKPGCGCPASCDDGNRCTEDYCDEDGDCKHTRIANCDPDDDDEDEEPVYNNCSDGDRCTLDYPSASGGCKHSRIPGCENPDDNNDYSTYLDDAELDIDPDSNIAVLNNGFASITIMAINDTGRSAAVVEPTLQGLSNYPVLIVPSGGFSGLETSDYFKTTLWNWVENGGLLISFTQQWGREFQALPGGEVTGYGWFEDNSCHSSSVGMTTYHPILSGIHTYYDKANIYVDGFFTGHSANTSVLVSRTKNGMPAMILYEYGSGTVLASTFYSDMSTYLYQRSNDGTVLLRDMFAWADTRTEMPTYAHGYVDISIPVDNPAFGIATGTFASFNPGDLVTMDIDVTNTGDIAADKVTFMLYDPRYNLADTIDVTQAVSVASTETVTFNYQTDTSDATGVWTIVYVLYEGDDFESMGLGGKLTLGYDMDEISQFQAYVTITNPKGDIIKDATMPLVIPPGRTGSIDVTVNTHYQYGIWSARYSVLAGDGSVLMSSSYLFAISTWAANPDGWVYQGEEIMMDMTSSHEIAFLGTPIDFEMHVYNNGDTDRTFQVQKRANHTDFGDREILVVPAGGMATLYYTLNKTSGLWLKNSVRLWMTLYDDETGQRVGVTSKGVDFYDPAFHVELTTDKAAYAAGEDILVDMLITNGSMLEGSADTAVHLLGPDGQPVLSGGMYPETLGPNESASHSLVLHIPDDGAYGNYQVRAVSEHESGVSGGDSVLLVVNSRWAADLKLDDTSYAAGETVNAELFIENTSTLSWASDVAFNEPLSGYTDTRNVSLASGENITLFFTTDIPEITPPGSYTVNVNFIVDNITLEKRFIVPVSDLDLSLTMTDVNAGEDLIINVTNDGGVTTEAQCKVLITFTDMISEETVNVPHGQTVGLALPVTTSVQPRQYTVFASCLDLDTNRLTSLSQYITIHSSQLELALEDTSYDAGENLVVHVTNTGVIDTGAACSMSILSTGVSNHLNTSIDVGQTVDFVTALPLSLSSGDYHVYVTCRDTQNGNVTTLGGTITVHSSELDLSLDTTAYTAGDTVLIDLTNTGAVDTSAGCELSLEDSAGNTFDDTGTYIVPAGQTVSIPFYIPDQAITDTYVLTAVCTDGNNGTSARLETTLAVSGTSADLTSVTDRTVYAVSDVVTLQTGITNTGLTLTDATLNRRIQGTVPGEDVTEDWVATYDSGFNNTDGPFDIAVDASGNVYVTGSSRGDTTRYDYATIKYDANGIELWTSRYDYGKQYDYANALALDSAGNVYVTGMSDGMCTTVKYAGTDGTELWVARYDEAVTASECNAIGIDGDGNIFVAGRSYNVGITGNDYLTAKLDGETGVQLWAKVYNGFGANETDEIYALAVDAAGNVYVTGWSQDESGISPDYVTIGYSGVDGTELWKTRYNGPAGSYDEAYDIAVDASGNVYVTGYANDYHDKFWASSDYATIKYNSEGVQQWVSLYEGTAEYDDEARFITVDDAGNVYVTGRSAGGEPEGSAYTLDIVTIKYNTDGGEIWTSRLENSYDTQNTTWDEITGGLALDAGGDVYIMGALRADYDEWNRYITTVKYNGASGAELWKIPYEGAYFEIWSTGYAHNNIAVDDDGNVYITSITIPLDDSAKEDYTTIKYSSTAGQAAGGTLWEDTATINVPAGGTWDNSIPLNILTDLSGATGTLRTDASLYNSLGQLVAQSDTETFYVAASELVLTMQTDKAYYHPGETIVITGEVFNTSVAAETCTLTVTMDGVPVYTDTFILASGETRAYNTSVTAVSTFTLQTSANAATVSAEIEVKPYGVTMNIIAPDIVGLDAFDAILEIENTSTDNYTVNVDFAGTTWNSLELPSGSTQYLTVSMSITENTNLTAVMTGDVPLTADRLVVMGEAAMMTVSPAAAYEPGTVPIPFTVDNTGLIDIEFEAVFTLNGDTAALPLFVAAGQSSNGTVSWQLPPGLYTLEYVSPYGSGNAAITVEGGPEFVVTPPENIDLVAGDPTWVFTVENVGGSGGFVEFSLRMPDWEDTQYAWIEAGESTDFTFIFDIPDDLEDGSYAAYFEMNGEKYSFTYNITGPKLAVTPSLDKELYDAGDTAVLTLDIENVSDFDLDLFINVTLGDYDTTQDFSLDAHTTTTLNFDVPVVFDRGKLFYGIYMASGRGLHLNAVYLHERGLLELRTDAQVYDIGDTVTVTMAAPAAGTVNLTAFRNSNLIALTPGTNQTQFTVPARTTGTYYIKYEFDGAIAWYPFDVRGYSGRITEFSLDKGGYEPGDTITVTATADINPGAGGVMSCRILDHFSDVVNEFGTFFSFAAGPNTIQAHTIFETASAGLYSVTCMLNADVSGETLMLASAQQYFDVLGVNGVPMSNAGTPYFATEGSSIVFNAGNSYDMDNKELLYRWDFEDDGTWDTDWSGEPTVVHTWNDDWDGLVKVEVDDGTTTDADRVMVRVDNVDPAVSAHASSPEVEAGKELTFSGSYADPGEDTHTIVWNFGDGYVSMGNLAASHAYTTGGSYTATLTVTDDDGGIGTATLSITVIGSSGGSPGGSDYVPMPANPVEDEENDEQDEEEVIEETPTPAAFSTGSIRITTGDIFEGDSFTIDIELANDGGTEGSYVLELELDGVIIEVRVITLGPGERTTITFTVTAGTPGWHIVRIGDIEKEFEVLETGKVAELVGFNISGLTITAGKITAGETVTITVVATNPGSSTATDTIILYINGTEVDSQGVTLDAGDSAMVSFTVVRDTEGNYDIRIGSLKGSFEVVLPETVTPAPQSKDQSSTFSWVWVAIIAGAVVVIGLVIGLLYLRRRD